MWSSRNVLQVDLPTFLITLTSGEDQRHLQLLPYFRKLLVADTLCGREFLNERLKVLQDAGRHSCGGRVRCRRLCSSRRFLHITLYLHHIAATAAATAMCIKICTIKQQTATVSLIKALLEMRSCSLCSTNGIVT